MAECTEQVQRFHRITTVISAMQVRTWLTEPPAKRIAARLNKAKASLKQSVDQAAEIAEQAVLDPTHDDVRVHLKVLNEQVGRLAIAAPMEDEPADRPRRRRWGRTAS